MPVCVCLLYLHDMGETYEDGILTEEESFTIPQCE